MAQSLAAKYGNEILPIKWLTEFKYIIPFSPSDTYWSLSTLKVEKNSPNALALQAKSTLSQPLQWKSSHQQYVKNGHGFQ